MVETHLKIQTSLLAAKTYLFYGIFQVEAMKLLWVNAKI
jgi:hypothetical protein